MIKERNFSTDDDFKTGFLSKLLLIIGVILLAIFIFFKVIAYGFGSGILYDFAQTQYMGTIVAFSIIFIGVGIILYFFHMQFVKLAKIADEIENEENDDAKE